MHVLKIFIVIACCSTSLLASAQDSVLVNMGAAQITAEDTAIVKPAPIIRLKHNPKKATFRSAVLPGWGQAYNREYWKIPIVWGALGTAIGIWIDNNTWYHRTRDAYIIVFTKDTGRYGEIHKRLISKQTGQPMDLNSLQFYRNEFRKNRDYATLWFVVLWGLNIADATVFAHLKEFDVSDDLSLRVQPNINPLNRTAGLSLSLNFKSPAASYTLASLP